MQKGNTLIFLLVGVFVLAVAGGAFYLGRSITPKPSPAPPPILTPSPTPDASPAPNGAGETANWKTYTNSALNYSINYPPGWGLDKCPPSFNSNPKDPTTYICSGEKFGDKVEPIFYYVYIGEYNFEPTPTIHLTQETINNLTAYRTTDFPSRSGAETVLFKMGNPKYISVGFTPFDRKNPYPEQSRFDSIFNQMLATFKFL